MAPQLSPVRARWCDGLPAVTGEIDCGGQRHRITWRNGKLVLEDHDLLAERSLTALGSEPPVCLEVLDAWRRTRDADTVCELLLAERRVTPAALAFRRRRHKEWIQTGGGRTPHLPAWTPSAVRAPLERNAVERLERAKRMWDVTLIEALPAGLRRALALSVIVGCERRWHDEEYRRIHGERMTKALAALADPLFEESARCWRRNLKPYARFAIDSRLVAPGEPPSCAATLGTDGARAVLSLPLAWFTAIWARGLALVDGCFVLGSAGRSAGETSVPVVAVRWERDAGETSSALEARAIATRRSTGGWSLHWV